MFVCFFFVLCFFLVWVRLSVVLGKSIGHWEWFFGIFCVCLLELFVASFVLVFNVFFRGLLCLFVFLWEVLVFKHGDFWSSGGVLVW